MWNKQHEGPEYPKLGASVAKFRSLASDGLRTLSREQIVAYANAVERGILSLQRAQLFAGLMPFNPRCSCASGTWHSNGDDIDKAIRDQQARKLAAYPAQARRARTPEQ